LIAAAIGLRLSASVANDRRELSAEIEAAIAGGFITRSLAEQEQFGNFDGNYGTRGAGAPIELGQGHTIVELMALDLPPIERICGPLMSCGITMLAGSAGVGKSLFALHLAAHIAAGEDLEEWKVPEPRKVIYVDGEMASQYLQGRAIALPATGDNLRLYHNHYVAEKLDGFINLARADHRAFFLRDEIFHLNDVFFFDTVSSLVQPSAEVSVYDPFYWLQLEPWHNEFRAAGKTVIWIDNLNKNGQIFGTSAKQHRVDSQWNFEALKDLTRHHDATAGFDIKVGKIRGESDSPKGEWQYFKNYGWRLM